MHRIPVGFEFRPNTNQISPASLFTYGHRGRIPWTDCNVTNRPPASLCRVRPGRKQRITIMGGDGNVELMERQRQAVAFRLDISFFSRPASKKGGLQFGSAKTAQRLALAFGEKTACQPNRLRFTPEFFYIYSDRPSLRKRHKRQTGCMGDVK